MECRQQSAADSFICGAGELWTLVRQHPVVMRSLFVSCDDAQLTFSSFRQIYTVQYSEVGSNMREAEDDTIYSWEVFLQQCEGYALLLVCIMV